MSFVLSFLATVWYISWRIWVINIFCGKRFSFFMRMERLFWYISVVYSSVWYLIFNFAKILCCACAIPQCVIVYYFFGIIYTIFVMVDVQENQCFCRNFLFERVLTNILVPLLICVHSSPNSDLYIMFSWLIAGASFERPFILFVPLVYPFLSVVWNETVYSTFQELILCSWCNTRWLL